MKKARKELEAYNMFSLSFYKLMQLDFHFELCLEDIN